MNRVFAALGTALLLLAAPAAVEAQTADRRQELATEFIRTMFEGGVFQQAMARELPAITAGFAETPGFRPEWKSLFEQAFLEELDHDLPKLHALFGRSLAAAMSQAELEAGLALLKTSGGQAMLRPSATGDRPTLTPAQERELQRALRSAEARRFASKLSGVEIGGDADKAALMTELLPGVLRRFGEKAEALEARR